MVNNQFEPTEFWYNARQFKPIGPAAVQTILATPNDRSLRVPCVLMRGGTSRGPFFLEADLPSDPRERERFLIAAHGLPSRAPSGWHRRRQPADQQGRDRQRLVTAGSRRRLPLRAGRDRPGLRRLQPELRQHAVRRRPLRDRGWAGAVPRSAKRPSGSSTATPRPLWKL